MTHPSAEQSLPDRNVIGDGMEDSGSEEAAPEGSPQGDAHLRVVEQRLRMALESGNLGSWDLDLTTHCYVDVSDIWKAHFGRPDATDVTQQDFLDWLLPEDRDRVHDLVEKAIETQSNYASEYRCVWPDKSIHWIRAYGTLLYDEAEKPLRMIGVTEDITDSKKREAEMQRELQAAQERADRDSLTGLWNHRAFHKRLEEETVRASREGTTLAVAMLDLDNFKFFNDVYGHVTGDDVMCQAAERLEAASRPDDTLARFGGDEFALVLPNIGAASAQEIEARLRAAVRGMAFLPQAQDAAIPILLSLGISLFPKDGPDRLDLLEAADRRLRRAKSGGPAETEADQVRLTIETQAKGFSMLDALVTAVDNKDRYTCRHSEDVMHYSLMIAQELGLDAPVRARVAAAALLHDVGKIGVPDAILRKPGRLTSQEFDAVKQHPAMGAAIVSAVPGFEDMLDAVRHHHERWDGQGYPAGLKAEETPLMARLMAVADAYSAMTTDRPYRRGMTRETALSILQAGAGSQWDPQCVQAFLAALED